MSAPHSLIQAALQRLGARVGSGLMDAAASISVLAQDAPERLRQELQLFWQEVEAEAERLERQEQSSAQAAPSSTQATPTQPADPQQRIDALRARIAQLTQRLEQS